MSRRAVRPWPAEWQGEGWPSYWLATVAGAAPDLLALVAKHHPSYAPEPTPKSPPVKRGQMVLWH